jgi:hypothetical protein
LVGKAPLPPPLKKKNSGTDSLVLFVVLVGKSSGTASRRRRESSGTGHVAVLKSESMANTRQSGKRKEKKSRWTSFSATE